MLVELAHFHPRLKGHGVLTYEDLMYLPFGKRGNQFILAAMFITAYGAMVAYLLIIKDTIPTVLGLGDAPGAGSFLEREGVMLVTSLVIMVPLSMQRDMSSLAFTSALSVCADVFLVLFIAAFSPIRETVGEAGGFGPVLKANWINSGFFIGFGVLTIAMTCQHSAFIVSGSLANLTSSRWGTVTSRSLTAACFLCAILGICGYLGFLEDTQGDILNNFEADTVQANAARVLLAITMFFTYPMEAFVARHVLMKLFFDGDMDGHVVDPNTGEAVPATGFFSRRVKWTLYIYVATLIPALIVDDLGPVMSITGAVGGSCLAYIGPGLVYLGVNGDAFLAFVAGALDSKNRKADPAAGELPVAGDAGANLQTTTSTTIPTGSKPWWWYPALMPFWIRVAEVGSEGMTQRLTALEQLHGPAPGEGDEGQPEDTETIGPCTRDYYISIFFVIFGFVAMVAGVLSNIYVQINGIFYTPT
jgi:sodium-coupled neutral amino acid transporter 11